MIQLSKCIYDSINIRYSVMDVVERFFPDDYEASPESDGWIHYNPCPFTGSTHFAFCVHTDESGFQIYTMKSHNYLKKEYEDLPESGTAAHILSILFRNENELLKLLIGEEIKPIITTHTDIKPIQKEKKHRSIDELHRMQILYRAGIMKNHDYLTNVRKFSLETIDHFQIGYSIREDVYTYPYILDGAIRHFKYKKADKVWHLPENSGGDYLFHGDALKQDNILIVEGEHDVMMIWQRYRIEAVGIGGCIGIGTERFRQIREACRGNTVMLCFDDDIAGDEYNDEFHMGLDNVAAKVIDVSHSGDGKDPDEWIKSGGELIFPAEVLASLGENRRSGQ